MYVLPGQGTHVRLLNMNMIRSNYIMPCFSKIKGILYIKTIFVKSAVLKEMSSYDTMQNRESTEGYSKSIVR